MLSHGKVNHRSRVLGKENEEIGRNGITLPTPLEDLIQGEGIPLIRKEKEVELMQVLIQEIQLERKFILVKMARIAAQLRVS